MTDMYDSSAVVLAFVVWIVSCGVPCVLFAFFLEKRKREKQRSQSAKIALADIAVVELETKWCAVLTLLVELCSVDGESSSALR